MANHAGDAGGAASHNSAGLAKHSRNMPGAAKDWANLNRDFPKAGYSGPAAGEPARAIWSWIQSVQPTWVVDLHEGTGIRAAGSKSVGSSIIVCPSPEAEEAARRMLQAVNRTIKDPKKQFVRLSPPVNGSLARAAAEHLHARAMILETSIHDLPTDPKRRAVGILSQERGSLAVPDQDPAAFSAGATTSHHGRGDAETTGDDRPVTGYGPSDGPARQHRTRPGWPCMMREAPAATVELRSSELSQVQGCRWFMLDPRRSRPGRFPSFTSPLSLAAVAADRLGRLARKDVSR